MLKIKEIKNYEGIQESPFNKGAGARSATGGSLKENNGITLIALIITIVLMLILASITVNVAINGGLFGYAKKAKDNTEIASEKETVQKASIIAEGTSKTGKITTVEMQKAIDQVINEGTATAIDNGETIVVKFNESNRYYEVDNKGNISEYTIHEDTTPGELAQNTEGYYMIESIEDLVVFSAMVNGGYSDSYVTIKSNNFSKSTVILMCNLNFNSNLSYNDYTSTIYNGYLGVDDTTVTLKEALTSSKYTGFIPIGNVQFKIFKGDFDGQGYEIQNIYINTSSTDAGLFGNTSGSDIKNLGISGNITVSAAQYFGAGLVTRPADNTVITNCYNKAIIKATGNLSSAGGIASGMGGVTIKNCYNTGNIIVTSGNYVGGIVSGHGNNKTTVINCYNEGTIEILNKAGAVGGILGTNGSTIENCYNNGKIVTRGTNYARRNSRKRS